MHINTYYTYTPSLLFYLKIVPLSLFSILLPSLSRRGYFLSSTCVLFVSLSLERFLHSALLRLYNATNTHLYYLYYLYVYIYFIYILYIFIIHTQTKPFPIRFESSLFSLSHWTLSFCFSVHLLLVCLFGSFTFFCVYIYNVCIVCI